MTKPNRVRIPSVYDDYNVVEFTPEDEAREFAMRKTDADLKGIPVYRSNDSTPTTTRMMAAK